jgi:hypothetical protein
VALHSPCGPWPFFQFLILYRVGRTPLTWNKSVVRPIPTDRTTCLYQKDERVLPGNLQNRKYTFFLPYSHPNVVSLTTSPLLSSSLSLSLKSYSVMERPCSFRLVTLHAHTDKPMKRQSREYSHEIHRGHREHWTLSILTILLKCETSMSCSKLHSQVRNYEKTSLKCARNVSPEGNQLHTLTLVW